MALPVSPRDRVTRLLRSLREVSVLWRDVTRVAFPAGSSGLGVLHLVEQQGPMRVSDLATCGHVGVSTMSRHVAELTTAGLLDRELSRRRPHPPRPPHAAGAADSPGPAGVLDRLSRLSGLDRDELAALTASWPASPHDLTAATGRAPERT